MMLTIRFLALVTVFTIVGVITACSSSHTGPSSLGSQPSASSSTSLPTSPAPIAADPTSSGLSGSLTPIAPMVNSHPNGERLVPTPQIQTSPEGNQPGPNPIHTPFPPNKTDQKNTGSFHDKFSDKHLQNTPSGRQAADLPYKPDRNVDPPMQDLPSLVVPIARASEVWEPIISDGKFRSIATVTAHDADVLELADGSYRAYYAVEGRKIVSSASQDGVEWIQDQGVRISNVAFPNAVLLDSGEIRLFYQDGMSIGSSISSDSGITFTKERGHRVALGLINGINLNNLGAPSTIRLSNGTYRMYFRGGIEDTTYWNGQRSYVFSASSPNAFEFTIDPGIRVDPSNFIDGGTGAPPGYERDRIHWVDGNDATLEPNGSVQLYFFSGFCFGLCMAISEDGLEFKNYEQVMSELVTPMNELANGNGRTPGDPSVLRTSNGQRLMYFGQGGHDVEPRELWGVYIAEIKH